MPSRRAFNTAVLALGLAGLAPVARAAVADDALRHLMTLNPLRGTGLGPEALAGKVALVTFFASWCPPCHAEFRHLNALHDELAQRGLRIVAVNVFEDFGGLSSPAKLAAFLDRYDPGFPILAGTEATKRAFDDLDRIPSLFVFDRAGGLRFRFRHAPGAKKTHLGEAELRAVLAPLI